nr:hypothetical protein KS05_30520 [Rhizobium brockwellii]
MCPTDDNSSRQSDDGLLEQGTGSPATLATVQLLGDFICVPLSKLHQILAVRGGRKSCQGVHDCPRAAIGLDPITVATHDTTAM